MSARRPSEAAPSVVPSAPNRAEGPTVASAAVLVAFLAVVAGVGLYWATVPGPGPSSSACPLDAPAVSDPVTPVHHLFVIVQENHAFENYFGDYPGVVGYPPNGTFVTGFNRSATVAPFALNASSTPDLPHDRASDLVDWDHGKNDLFVAQANASGAAAPADAVGYYTAAQVGGYWEAARSNGMGDNFFTGVLGPTQPNRVFDITAFSGDGWYSDSAPPSNVTAEPTLLGQLTNDGIPWDYDFIGPPVNLAPLWFPSLVDNACSNSRIVPMQQLGNQLNESPGPSVVFVDASNSLVLSEHPPENVTTGQDWALATVAAIRASPFGPSSAILLFYDENGGYWDPVPPPTTSTGLDGFRVPFLVFSPWTPAGTVCSTTLDPAAVLRFVDMNWGLPPLNARVAEGGDLGCFFHFPATLAGGPAPPVLRSPGPTFFDQLRATGRDEETVPGCPSSGARYLGKGSVRPSGIRSDCPRRGIPSDRR